MATMSPHQQHAPTSCQTDRIMNGTGTSSSTGPTSGRPMMSSSIRRGSVTTGSVRNIIKNLAALSTSTALSSSEDHPFSSSSFSSSSPSSSSPSSALSSLSSNNSGTLNGHTSVLASGHRSMNGAHKDASPVRKHIIEEINDDSIYSVQLKKITYSCNTSQAVVAAAAAAAAASSSTASTLNGRQAGSNLVTKCDQVDHRATSQRNNNNNHNSTDDNQQSLQWETRQLRTIKGATLEHLVKYVLLLTPVQSRLRCRKPTRNGAKSQNSHHHRSDADGGANDAANDADCDADDFDDEDPRYVEERNNVAHAMHVLFATYRQFAFPSAMFEHIIRQRSRANTKQFNFILYYWLNNYPEDFWMPCQTVQTKEEPHSAAPNDSTHQQSNKQSASIHEEAASEDGSSIYSEYNTLSSTSSGCSIMAPSRASTENSTGTLSSSSSASFTATMMTPLTLADQLISMRQIDEDVKKHCLHLLDMKRDNNNSIGAQSANGAHQHHNHTMQRGQSSSISSTSTASSVSSSTSSTTSSSQKSSSINKTSSILDLDAKFIAQQLTAIDLENFLTLKPYTLLSNVRSKTKIETLIRNFNLLSRHVIVTILQSSNPQLVTMHWIEVASQLRRMRNFNSLKACIAGLTNESIYRLKTTIWNKLPRAAMTNFHSLSSIVDDVNNQTLLRHTQLFIEGTSKVALEESFGTIPYLGTFLTDITMINTRYHNHIKPTLKPGETVATATAPEKKLINFEKCAKQYEILMQMQLLQKNAIAALQQQQQQNYHLGPIYSLNHYLSLRSQTVPSIPRVARIFRNWFQLAESDMLNDKECYQISLNIEPNVSKASKSSK